LRVTIVTAGRLGFCYYGSRRPASADTIPFSVLARGSDSRSQADV
jgi:hypothetical protein